MDVAFRVITANQKPDYSTVCHFRFQNEEELGMLFTQVLRLCAEAGLVKAGLVALDGRRLKLMPPFQPTEGRGILYDIMRKTITTFLCFGKGFQ